MAQTKFYHCSHCGNVVAVLSDGDAAPSCCGEPMELLVARTEGAGADRHVPVVSRDGEKLVVRVGEVRHDMVEEHLIEWVAVEREGRLCLAFLKSEEEPVAKEMNAPIRKIRPGTSPGVLYFSTI